jgi:hypothetical protein
MPKTAAAELSTQEAAQLDLVEREIFGDGSGLPPAADAEAMSRAIAERILSAETFEEAFKPQSLDGWANALLEVPVFVQSVHFNRSGIEGQSIYAVVDVSLASDGKVVTVSCGGKNVLAQLVQMLRMGWTDRPVRIVSKRTAEGYDALWLEAV